MGGIDDVFTLSRGSTKTPGNFVKVREPEKWGYSVDWKKVLASLLPWNPTDVNL